MTPATPPDETRSVHIQSILAAKPIATSPSEIFEDFVAWSKDTGAVSPRLLDFLEAQGGFACAPPVAYQQLTRIGESEWFKAQPGDQRRSISTLILGEETMKVYLSWISSLTGGEPA